MRKRVLSILIAALMVVSLLPVSALAQGKTIAGILPDGFPTYASTAWVCRTDRNKVIYKGNDNLIIGSYASGKFNGEQNFDCPTASEVTLGEGSFYYCNPEGYGTVKFNMEGDVLKSITFDSTSSFEGTYSPLTMGDILPDNFPTSYNGAWENSKENNNVCVYKDEPNLTFYDTEVAVSLSSLLTRAERNQDNESFACTFEYVGESNFTIQFNMNNDSTALENIIVSNCTYNIVDGTYAPSEETVSYAVTYNANGATSGTAPTNQKKHQVLV